VGENPLYYKEEIKMAKYRVVVVESQSYEVYVEADTKEEAEEIAGEDYGCCGDIFSTNVDVVLVEEETE
jgi:hypothetical protein